MSGWQYVQLKVVTPMFCGGVNQEPELRVSSIKGEARFWLRAILGGVLGKDLDRIGEVESSIFGSVDKSSRVIFRLTQLPVPCTEEQSLQLESFVNTEFIDEETYGFKGLAYLLGQGLCTYARASGKFNLTRKFIPDGSTFNFLLRRRGGLSDASWELAQWALWAAFVLGGIGARNRRGFGRAKVLGTSFKSGIFSENPIGKLVSKEGIEVIFDSMKAAACKVVEENFDEWTPEDLGSRSDFPSLSAVRTHVSSRLFLAPWNETLREVGLEWRLFRANEEAPRARYNPKCKTYEWLHVINGRRESNFELGALGLPIIFKAGQEVHAVANDKENRWPSPLFLTPVEVNGGFLLVSLFFQLNFLPPVGTDTPKVLYRETENGKVTESTLIVADDAISTLTDEWFKHLDQSAR